jgi:uncharacterized protein (TIGR03067 family)
MTRHNLAPLLISVLAVVLVLLGLLAAAGWGVSRYLQQPPPVVTATALAPLVGHTGPVRGVAWSGDGSRIATASADKTIRIWDAAASRLLGMLTGHKGEVVSIAVDRTGGHVVSASWDNTVRLWDANTNAEMQRLDAAALGVAISDEGRWVACVVGSQVRLWDTAGGAELTAIGNHGGAADGVAITGNGDRMASVGEAGSVTVWDPLKPNVAVSLTGSGFTNRVTTVAFSTDGGRLAAAGQDRVVVLWDWRQDPRKPIAALRGHTDFVSCVAFSGDGRLMVSGSDDGTIRLWDPGTAKELGPPLQIQAPVACVAVSPDGRRIAAGVGNDVLLWQVTYPGEESAPIPPQPPPDKGTDPPPDKPPVSPPEKTITPPEIPPEWLNSRFGEWAIYRGTNPRHDGALIVSQVSNQAIYVAPESVGEIHECDRDGKWWVIHPSGERLPENLNYVPIADFLPAKRAAPPHAADRATYDFTNWKVTVGESQIVLVNSVVNRLAGPGAESAHGLIIGREAVEFKYAGRTYGAAERVAKKPPVSLEKLPVAADWLNTRFGNWSIMESHHKGWPGAFLVSREPRQVIAIHSGSVGWIYHWDAAGHCQLLLPSSPTPTTHAFKDLRIEDYLEAPLPERAPAKSVYSLKNWRIDVSDDQIEFTNAAASENQGRLIITRSSDDFQYVGRIFSPTLTQIAKKPEPKGPPPPDTTEAAAQLQRLQGTWVHPKLDLRVKFEGDQFTYETFGKVAIAGTFSLRTDTVPAGIDIVLSEGKDMGRVIQSIYRFGPGDKLDLVEAKVGMARPINFSAGAYLELQRSGTVAAGNSMPSPPKVVLDVTGRLGGAGSTKYYDVVFEANKTYVIDMKRPAGSSIDPYLTLYDPGGKAVAFDDDGGGFPNARIVHRAARAGRYRVMCSGFGATFGAYTLSVVRQ